MSVSDIIATFPYKELTPIVGKPSFATLARLKKEATANAASIHSSRGTGTMGHARIVIGIAAYNALAPDAAQHWVDPVNPGNMHIPANATQYQIATGVATHERRNKEWLTYLGVEKAIKQQVLKAVDNVYVSSLEDPTFGFANVTVHAIIAHLENTYAEITPDILSANLVTLHQPWEPTESLEPLWHRGVECQAVAAAGNEPITEATLLRTYRKLFQDTGIFQLDIRAWDDKPNADKTLANFKTHFTRANQRRLNNITVGQMHNQPHSASAFAARSTPATTVATDGVITVHHNATKVQMGYCWTHGVTSNASHNSRTCTNKAPGHQNDATIDNMKGGNDRVRRRPKEKTVYKPPKRSRVNSPQIAANVSHDNSSHSDSPNSQA